MARPRWAGPRAARRAAAGSGVRPAGGRGRRRPRASARRRGGGRRSRRAPGSSPPASAASPPAIPSRSRTPSARAVGGRPTPVDPQRWRQVDQPADLEPGALVERREPLRPAREGQAGTEQLRDRDRRRSAASPGIPTTREHGPARIPDGRGDRLGEPGLADPGLAFDDRQPAVRADRPPRPEDRGELDRRGTGEGQALASCRATCGPRPARPRADEHGRVDARRAAVTTGRPRPAAARRPGRPVAAAGGRTRSRDRTSLRGSRRTARSSRAAAGRPARGRTTRRVRGTGRSRRLDPRPGEHLDQPALPALVERVELHPPAGGLHGARRGRRRAERGRPQAARGASPTVRSTRPARAACQSSKAGLSRTLNPARNGPRARAAAASRSAGSPEAARRSTSARSTHVASGSSATRARSISQRRRSPTALRNADSVRRSAPRAASSSRVRPEHRGELVPRERPPLGSRRARRSRAPCAYRRRRRRPPTSTSSGPRRRIRSAGSTAGIA